MPWDCFVACGFPAKTCVKPAPLPPAVLCQGPLLYRAVLSNIRENVLNRLIKKQGYITLAFVLHSLILRFADAEHPGPAFCAGTLGAGFAVLHPDGPDILHFPVGPAFHAISFHKFASWILTLIIAAALKLLAGFPLRYCATSALRIIPCCRLEISIGLPYFA